MGEDKESVNENSDINSSDNKGAKESFYDKIPLSKKQLDVIIIVLVCAIIVFLVLGALIGNRVL